MTFHSPYFVLGTIFILYLLSFVAFAILRIATGVSIQRLGYFSLRRIAYTPWEGIRIEVRTLGLSLHRPTFAQPTWVSIRIRELKVTFDAKAIARKSLTKDAAPTSAATSHKDTDSGKKQKSAVRRSRDSAPRSQLWKRLTRIKEQLKSLHQNINWLSLVDIVATDTSIVLANAASFEVGALNVAVDTRRQTVDRGRLFQHKKIPEGGQRPAEWIFTVRGILFTGVGKEPLEIVDICNLNVHGLLYKEKAGLRDASIALKLGRVHVPYDDMVHCYEHIHKSRKHTSGSRGTSRAEECGVISFEDQAGEFHDSGSKEESIVQTVSDSKEFVSSILRGIQEVQMAVSFIGLSKELNMSKNQTIGGRSYLNLAMNEFGIDMHRLDPKSPAHRMYFAPKDVAHQALLAAISIAVSLDDARGKPERIAYVPMATATIKTTLPSKTVSFSEDNDVAERNTNIVYANLVVTSPSIDVDPSHMPLVLALAQWHRRQPQRHPPQAPVHHQIVRRLLPKASIKLSIHEPVLRVALPPASKSTGETDDYDLLICAITSISLDLESSHSPSGDLHYSLVSHLRISSHQFFYQNASGVRHDLFVTHAVELRTQIDASPELCVQITGEMRTFSVHMVRPEISAGVRQILQHLNKRSDEWTLRSKENTAQLNPIRSVPHWLAYVQIQGSNFGIEVAGIDDEVSADTRGIALQLENWTAEYKTHRSIAAERPSSRRRSASKIKAPEESDSTAIPSQSAFSQSPQSSDGRRLAIHVRGFDGFIVEGVDIVEPEAFISLPRGEIAFSTTSDTRGHIIHVHAHVRALYIHYSLYRSYAIAIAFLVLRKALVHDGALEHVTQSTTQQSGGPIPSSLNSDNVKANQEILAVDIKTDLIQLKATLPAKPHMMLHIFAVEAGQHRWAAPFIRSKLGRLYVQASQTQSAWTRITSLKNVRVDLRESRRRLAHKFVEERSFDIASDCARMAIPHQLVPHSILDNFANVLKTNEQLFHRFWTGTNQYILTKSPEGPRKVPRISLRSKILVLELEDGPFEWKLGSIYRAGLMEQKQRLARQEAFDAKLKNVKKMKLRRGSSQLRASSRSIHGRSPSEVRDEKRYLDPTEEKRSLSKDRSHPHAGSHGGRLRYDPEGQVGLSESSEISEQEARYKLQLYNAQSWKRRIDTVYRRQNLGMREMRSAFLGTEDISESQGVSERIVTTPERPGLLAAWINDVHLIIDKPSFPINDYPDFIHRVGKGMPKNMEYTLLIPCNINLSMGEARVTLRDYPLPLLHVPALKLGQSSRLPSWSLKTDFVIAEEFRGPISCKRMKVEVVPRSKISDLKSLGPFVVDVERTISPTKTYSDIEVTVNTSETTSIMWGTAYQPAIQDAMMTIEAFTKPQVDPSDRIGFWDKIRLNFHSRVSVLWTSDGDVHLRLKGSRDPYVVTGYGAGFVMCWRNNVRWDIHRSDDPKRFMSVRSGEYLLAIPDYSQKARASNSASGQDTESVSSTSSGKSGSMFKKVIMKLSGNVQWLAGLVLERELEEGSRSFTFTPHYDIILTTPDKAQAPSKKVYDAFRGFRSNYIHLSLAIVAPLDRDWKVNNTTPSQNYNTIHLTPRFFTHFFDWWSLFSGVMSLPIRQGNLFPGIDKASKKFGRHLATIKYNILLSPLFITHNYIHKDAEDYAQDVVSATGLKLRIDSFMLDLHQRREEFAALGRGRSKQMRTSGMRINEAQLDLISADVRAISASIAGTSAHDLKQATDEDLTSYSESSVNADLSRFSISDQDFSWVDMDDFVEIDWILPVKTAPETQIIPLAFAPRFTYFRQTDHGDSISGNNTRTSPFGDESTHLCVMTRDNDPRLVQSQLISERIKKVQAQMSLHERTLGEQELRVVRDGNRDGSLKDRFERLRDQGHRLIAKEAFLKDMLRQLTRKMQESDADTDSASKTSESESTSQTLFDQRTGSTSESAGPASSAPVIHDFNNRFIIHNAQVKWNNSLRNVILRYVHQVSQRRGFIYYMTRRAVKFILDIIQEQHRNYDKGQGRSGNQTPTSPAQQHGSGAGEHDERTVEERIMDLLNDQNRSVEADDSKGVQGMGVPTNDDEHAEISEDFTPVNSYHLRLIAPQIQLQSEKNPHWVVLVTAKSMQLKVIQIMDKGRMADDVSGLVQRRFSVDMDSVQFFVSNRQMMMQFLHFYSENRYGSPKGSAWPPWVPFEVNFDFQLDPFGFARVVQRTSASLQYDKYNTLRLKFNDNITTNKGGTHGSSKARESKIDRLRIDFPQMRAICDSAQYYTMYVIVVDLLLYSEPLEKVRSERLEKIMFASDFSDLRGAPEMVIRLQEKIRQLEEIKTQFQIRSVYLDRRGWQDRLTVEEDLAGCEDELFFMMKAITTSQRKVEERNHTAQTSALLRWNFSADEIVWHLMRDKTEPMMEIQLQNAAYDRIDNSDGSNHNMVEIDRIYGLNLLPNALYPQMISPFVGKAMDTTTIDGLKMLSIHWHMLEAIAGIPVLDNFEVNLFPLKVQLEREIGKKVFEYIFPSNHTSDMGGEQTSDTTGRQRLATQDEGNSSDRDDRSILELNGSRSETKDTIGLESISSRLQPTKYVEPRANGKLHKAKSQPRITKRHSNLPGDGRLQRAKGSEILLKQQNLDSRSRQSSRESLSLRRSSHEASTTSLSAMNGTADRHKMFTLNRTNSKNISEEEEHADDLTRMMSRASNYMTLAYVKVPSVVLCLSYKGRGERNFEDIHDFVFRMPVLEYRNKTWSNLDLALRLKKDVIKALISHTGAIIGNKITRHKPSIKTTSRLRELANASSVLPNTNSLFNTSRDRSSDIPNLPYPTSDIASRSSISTSSRTYGTESEASSFQQGPLPEVDRSESNLPSSEESVSGNDHRTGAASEKPNLLRQSTITGNFFSKHATGDAAQRSRLDPESTGGETGETGRRKGVFMLGRKILGSLNDR